ncbi:DUF1566 domain-containing protein [Patescibacteria group bacterium]|nr:DUF1566 domain-containing protein [Patescibacteria group bacterium]
MVHLSAATIAFAATTPGTITDSGNGLALFKTADVITITGSASNDGVYTISTGGVAGTIRTTEATLLEAAGATVSIAKREAMSNNCVLDRNTGLMWARYQGTKQGITSNGAICWTGKPYDAFAFVAAANAAALGGYTDWRLQNANEALSIMDSEAPTAFPDVTAFPSWPQYTWTSTTVPGLTVNAYITQDTSMLGFNTKTIENNSRAPLVRGG